MYFVILQFYYKTDILQKLLPLDFFFYIYHVNTDDSNKDLHENICDDHLFSSLFNKHAKAVHDFLYYKFGEEFDPKDKMQEAFIKLWENCAKVPPSKARSYLFTVANNLMLNATAHKKVILKYQQKKPKTYTNEDPEFLMETDQYMDRLQNAIANLSEAQRTAFLMNRIEGKKHKEIAEILGISNKAVEKRIYGALKKLREDIKEL